MKSSTWSAYTLFNKTPSYYLDELITTTVSDFIRGRVSILNVYKRKQFATIISCQLELVPQAWNNVYLLSLWGQFLIMNEKLCPSKNEIKLE